MVGQPETLEQNLPYKLGLGLLLVRGQSFLPIIPAPPELEVYEVVEELLASFYYSQNPSYYPYNPSSYPPTTTWKFERW